MKAFRIIGLIALAIVVLLAAGLLFYWLYPQNLSRRPPELDALRTDVLKQTHIEAEFITDNTFFGEPILEGHVQVLFPHVPPAVDKAEIERVARALVKEHLPHSTEVDVRFGDNLRTAPLEIDEPDDPFKAFKPKKRTSLPSR